MFQLIRHWLDRPPATKHSRRTRLTFDVLEARAVPASRVVETLWDPGDPVDPDLMTLRRAIEEINSMAEPSNSIIFDSSLSGAVWLSSALPPLMVPMSIDGETASGRVTVIRDDSPEANMPDFRIFEVMAFLDLSNMVVMGGREAFGGGLSIGTGATAYLTNVLVSANNADDGAFGGTGGGIHNDGTLVVTASTIASNWASNMGGGIHNMPLASLTVQNGSVVASNQAWRLGGGISNSLDGNAQVMMSEIEYNWAGDVGVGFEGFGGGIYNAGTLDMSDSTLRGNPVLLSGCQGGGLFCEGGSSATLSYVTITGNSATNGNDGKGGGFYVVATGQLSLTGCTLSGNQADVAASTGGWVEEGAIYSWFGEPPDDPVGPLA